jgi:hypothetical protein
MQTAINSGTTIWMTWRRKLQLATGKKLVVIESIYSMDGDEAPIEINHSFV